MIDLALVLVVSLLGVVVWASVVQYRRLRKAQSEYEKARDAVADIVLSFSRELRRETKRLQLVAYKVETYSSRSDRALAKAEEADQRLKALDSRFDTLQASNERVTSQQNEADRLTRDVIASQENLISRLASIEDQTRQASVSSEFAVQTVIPIKRDRALAPLTESELAALEILANEGSKTAPEIKERIKLSREHTARLMKKLYEGGYLERDPSKVPFRYSVKKEMEKLLKKAEGGVV